MTRHSAGSRKEIPREIVRSPVVFYERGGRGPFFLRRSSPTKRTFPLCSPGIRANLKPSVPTNYVQTMILLDKA